MHRRLLPDILIAVSVAAVLLAASFAGLPGELGAHPWWAQQSGIIGGIGGAVLWLVLRRAGAAFSRIAVVSLLAFSASIAAAHFGKQVFADSFAENTLAGRYWYFGWIALSGSVALLLAAAAALVLRR